MATSIRPRKGPEPAAAARHGGGRRSLGRARGGNMSKAATALASTVAAALVGLLPVPAVSAAAPMPPGYRLATEERLAPGVLHQTLVRRDPDQVVHVARISRSAEASLRVVR